ncbi:MAG: DNA polymerase, partial [Actinomycetota bacterium]
MAIDLENLGITPRMDDVRRLFDFLEFKTMPARFNDVMTTLGVDVGTSAVAGRTTEGGSAQYLSAEVETATDAETAAGLVAGASHLSIAGRWHGEPGRSPLAGVAAVLDRDAARVLWLPWDVIEADARSGRVLAAALERAPIWGHDVKAVMRSLLETDIDLGDLRLDTAIAAYLSDPGQNHYSLADLVERHASVLYPDDDAGTRGELDLDGTAIGPDQLAGRDALAIAHVGISLLRALDSQGMHDLYRRMENPLVRVLARMEHIGIGVDRDELTRIAARLTAEARELSDRIQELAGYSFNPNSPAQLGKILFEERGLVPPKKNKTGFSTDAATLEKLRE